MTDYQDVKSSTQRESPNLTDAAAPRRPEPIIDGNATSLTDGRLTFGGRMMHRITLAILLSATFAAAAAGQRTPSRPPAVRVKSKGPLTLAKDDKREPVIAKALGVGADALRPGGKPIAVARPDLTVSGHTFKGNITTGEYWYYVTVENKGPAAAPASVLRFMYGKTWDDLKHVDYDVPALPAGKSVQVEFKPAQGDVHWWLFGVDPGNALKEADFSNNLYVVELGGQ